MCLFVINFVWKFRFFVVYVFIEQIVFNSCIFNGELIFGVMKNFLDIQGRVSGLEVQFGLQEWDLFGFGDVWVKGGVCGIEIVLFCGM